MERREHRPRRCHKSHLGSCIPNAARCPPCPDSSEGKSWGVEAGLVSLRLCGNSPRALLSSTFLDGPLDFPGPCCAVVLLVGLGWVVSGHSSWVGLRWVTHLGLG